MSPHPWAYYGNWAKKGPYCVWGGRGRIWVGWLGRTWVVGMAFVWLWLWHNGTGSVTAERYFRFVDLQLAVGPALQQGLGRATDAISHLTHRS